MWLTKRLDRIFAPVRSFVALGLAASILGVVGFAGVGSASTNSSQSVGVPATSVSMTPNGLAVDSAGNVYVADMANHVVDRITSNGVLSVVAGVPGQAGTSTPGSALDSKLSVPAGLVVSASGDLYIGDSGIDNVVDKVDLSTGQLSIIAGVPEHVSPPNPNNLATASYLHGPNGLALDSSGNLYIADSFHSVIEKQNLQTGTFSIIAGISSVFAAPSPSLPATQSGLYLPEAVAVNSAGDVYIADAGNHVVEELSPSTGKVSIVAGVEGETGVPFNNVPAIYDPIGTPTGLALDSSGNLFIADASNNVVEEVSASTGNLSIVAGIPGTSGAPTPGDATRSALSTPDDVAVSSTGNLYIADSGNNLVDKVVLSTDQLSIFAGTGQAPAQTSPVSSSSTSPSSSTQPAPVTTAPSSSNSALGYYLTARDGGVFTFGDAHFYGSLGAIKLNAPVVGITPTPDGKGYYLVASDGGVFTFGDAHFYGSLGATKLNAPIVGITPTPDGKGYYLVASDGGVFTFGDAHFYGSLGATKLNAPVVGGAEE